MSFVKTPEGVIMDADNHRAMVALATEHGLGNVLAMLVPAEPYDPQEIFQRSLLARDLREETRAAQIEDDFRLRGQQRYVKREAPPVPPWARARRRG